MRVIKQKFELVERLEKESVRVHHGLGRKKVKFYLSASLANSEYDRKLTQLYLAYSRQQSSLLLRKYQSPASAKPFSRMRN
jgi:hypothetical protein